MTPQAEIDWRDTIIPVSRRFDDPYFSVADGLAETRHVFLTGNGLPHRLRDGFHIAELGFGTGLNLLALAEIAAATPGTLHFTSFEAYPLAAPDMARALAAFPALDAGPLLAACADMPGARHHFTLHNIQVTLIFGDARATLPLWEGRADAWFLDGFSPAKNPELWQPDLMDHVARHTAPQGSFATYTAAGFVRAGLAQAGFTVTRQPGHGRKRHMTTGVLP
ncbi:tRNA (5-methylaminomethyl-2-thiouridine)(34)-methyltransferase MnmD [Roseicitreum antarcticum]|uniref:tRNA U34 5-methylaminomethyl-2-thiouridine-forming methyltransferase MnmC n=1 Tax=Roseicitreum antarcticum TaxID=564137 RepID=A0A1H2RK63_9RHOB|nr:tRNA (5-methylaminomethyl-2-thiouridine)(34)-methyltransferase MnmD [Roseicitreum antarcticum]SDW19862.1 tRNA U34 5-methylaminomethyl-2-thiouridine-forming methyltransferase MnmC [Roseicitreum antarcticum]